MAELD
jgi:hypothetical protein